MKEKITTIWKDPVLSKIISAAIIGVVALVYNAIIAYSKNIDFYTVVTSFIKTDVKLWVILILLLFYLIVLIIRKKIKKNKEVVIENKEVEFEYDDRTLKLDIDLFNKIRYELLTHGNIQWLRTNNFAGFSFKDDLLTPFDLIEIESSKADFEFLNPKLETLRKDLINDIIELNSLLLKNIFREGKTRLSVPSEWETEQPERFWTAVEEIHLRTQSIGKKYDELIKASRRILKV